MRSWSVMLAGVAAAVLSGCAGEPARLGGAGPGADQGPPPAAGATLAMPDLMVARAAEYPGLHNVVTYAPGVMSGSMPDGAAGFDSLRAMGVRTVISVDGATPDAAAARARGMRYVHLPITYGGIEASRQGELARAVRDLPKPMYIHCHHGKHRSAAAAGVAVVMLDETTPEEAAARMKVSGTSESYPGLWACVLRAAPAHAARIDAADGTFPEAWAVTGIVAAMVQAQQAFDHLKQIEAAGWTTPVDHPDLVPAVEAGLLAEALRVSHEDQAARSRGAELLAWLDREASTAMGLEEAIVAVAPAGALSVRFAKVARGCADCHAVYRDK